MRSLFFIGIFSFSVPFSVFAKTAIISPTYVTQGDPIMITVTDASTSYILSGKISGTLLHFTTYDSVPTAFYGVDINQKIGTTSVIVRFIIWSSNKDRQLLIY